MKFIVVGMCLMMGLLLHTSMVECFANRQANIKQGNPINDVDLEQVENIPLRWFRRVTRKSRNVERFLQFHKARIVNEMVPIIGQARGKIFNVYIIE